MNTEHNQAYNYYKDAYPERIIVFRVGDHYEAFLDDALFLSQIGDKVILNKEKDVATIPESELWDIMAMCDKGFKIITCRCGSDYGVPNVKELIKDKEIDY